MTHMPTRAQRILIVTPDLQIGGAELVLLRLAEEFVRVARGVHLVSLVGDGPLAARLPSGVVLHSLSGSPGIHRRGFALAISALPRLVKLFRALRPDAVLSSMTGTNLVTVLARQFSWCDTRLVLREESSAVNLLSHTKRLALPALYARADAIIAVSEGVARDVQKLGLPAEMVHVIRNPVDIQGVRRLAAVGPGLADHDRGPYVMALGRLTGAKDYPTLLRAYATSALRVSHRLVIVGEGEQRADLENLVRELDLADRVSIPGAMDNPYRVLADASLLVLSSRWEGLGNVLLEAMALDVPVVSTDCPHGPREVLDGGRYGRLAPVADPSALALAMEAELANRSTVAGDVLARYAPPLVAASHLAVLDGEEDGGTSS